MSKDQHYFEIDVPQIPKPPNENPDLVDNLTEMKIEETSFLDLIFPNFKLKSFTFIISVLQMLLYVFTCIYYYAKDSIWECVLYKFGAGFEPAIRNNFEIYRLFFTPIFLHYNLYHLLSNILGQAIILFHLEASYSKITVISLYFLSHLGGAILSNMVYFQLIRVGASLALFGSFAFEIINLINKNSGIIFNNKWRFGVCCIFCGILSFPILRVFDNKSKIKTYKQLKLILFYFFIALYFVVYIIFSINTGINFEKENDKPARDENFHWIRLLFVQDSSNSSNKNKSPAVVDDLGHLGKT